MALPNARYPATAHNLHLPREKPKAAVIVVEGEKSAEVAAQLLPDHVCLTSPNGPLAAAKETWKPLDGRDVAVAVADRG